MYQYLLSVPPSNAPHFTAFPVQHPPAYCPFCSEIYAHQSFPCQTLSILSPSLPLPHLLIVVQVKTTYSRRQKFHNARVSIYTIICRVSCEFCLKMKSEHPFTTLLFYGLIILLLVLLLSVPLFPGRLLHESQLPHPCCHTRAS